MQKYYFLSIFGVLLYSLSAISTKKYDHLREDTSNYFDGLEKYNYNQNYDHELFRNNNELSDYELSEQENEISSIELSENDEEDCENYLSDDYCYSIIDNLGTKFLWDDNESDNYFIDHKSFFRKKYRKSLVKKKHAIVSIRSLKRKIIVSKNKKLSKIYNDFLFDTKKKSLANQKNKNKFKNNKKNKITSKEKQIKKTVNHRQLYSLYFTNIKKNTFQSQNISHKNLKNNDKNQDISEFCICIYMLNNVVLNIQKNNKFELKRW